MARGAGGQLGGQGHPVKRAIWVFIAACIAVAVLGDVPHDPAAFVDRLQATSAKFEKTINGWVDQTPIPGTTEKEARSAK